MDWPGDSHQSDMAVKLRELMADASDLVHPGLLTQVHEFVDHSEYGLALIWLVGTLEEYEVLVPDELLRRIGSLADSMGIDAELPEQYRYLDSGRGEAPREHE